MRRTFAMMSHCGQADSPGNVYRPSRHEPNDRELTYSRGMRATARPVTLWKLLAPMPSYATEKSSDMPVGAWKRIPASTLPRTPFGPASTPSTLVPPLDSRK